MRAELTRTETSEHGTFGTLRFDDTDFCVTLERPWLDNKPRVSCIPPGTYTCRRVKSPRFGNTFEITGVTDRAHILFHAGNLMRDSLGCVLLGKQRGTIAGVPGIIRSRMAFDDFLDRLEGVDEFVSTVTWQQLS